MNTKMTDPVTLLEELANDVRSRFFWRVGPDWHGNHVVDDAAVKAVNRLCDAIALMRAPVGDGYVLIQKSDAERLGRFGLNNAGDGLRSSVKLSAMRVLELCNRTKEGGE